MNQDEIFERALRYLKAGRIEQAILEYEKWLVNNPSDEETLRVAAELWERIGKGPEAVRLYRRLAWHYERDQVEAARIVEVYREILRLDPDNEEARLHLSRFKP